MLIGEVLNKVAKEKEGKIVASCENNKLTYSELEKKTNQLAKGIINLGINVEDMVSILLPNSIDFLIAYFGIIKSGATMVPINIMYKPPAIEYILNNSETKVLITSRDFLTKVQGCDLEYLKEIIIIEEERVEGCKNLRDFFKGDSSYHKVESLSPDNVAACLYTSGTTGDPKGAMLTHKNLVFDTESSIEHLKVDSTGRYLCVLPMFHAFAETVCMLMPVFLGATIIIMKKFLPEEVLKTIQEKNVTFFSGVPTMYIALLNVRYKEKYDLSHLELCLSGGAAMPVKAMEEFEDTFNVTIVEGDGPTEASPVAYVNPVNGTRKPGSVGIAIPGVKVRIVDENDKEVSRGDIGEIAIYGDNVMKGYFKKNEATSKALQNGWLHTGDMGKMDAEDYIYIVDRKKDMINVGGLNVYPREIEEYLYTNPKIREAAVVAMRDELRGEVPKAFVVLKDDVEATTHEFRRYCIKHFANYKVPKEIEFIEELPKNATGKIDKKLLREI
ncbi:long-chain-fatty-acid--CoA ligase [Orenia marismortui]|uniref:Long-chain acyl-CoA synthetase n=1 Tax=Orenia marismortui TaxID=46469 RepID=A0A4V3H018_9FIRM|nr:long-chain fatty acid--CoA ligase [Orenia marismortui]TDX58999.1 long-chain acyl-CoA synthetase [Orenia marismortui]